MVYIVSSPKLLDLQPLKVNHTVTIFSKNHEAS